MYKINSPTKLMFCPDNTTQNTTIISESTEKSAQNRPVMKRQRLVQIFLLFSIFVCALCFRLFCSLLYDTRGKFRNSGVWRGGENAADWRGDKNVIWFVQISDLHINVFGQSEIVTDLENFCGDFIQKIIQPAAVFVTGDIFDCKNNFFKGTGLNIEECRIYHQILEKTQVYKHTIWRDVRGNHDASQTTTNDQKCYSEGRPNEINKLGESYQTVITRDFGTYNFLLLDLAPIPGMLLPLNFFGVIKEENIDFLEHHSQNYKNYNHTIVMSHYPLSAMKYNRDIRKLRSYLNGVISYQFGHFHANKNMYARDPDSGTLLLELGDWRTNRRFRIFAFDNDIFSIRDFYFKKDSDVMILITNPKNVKLASPSLEPLFRISQSSHIRALVFSVHKIQKITAFIDSKQLCSFSDHHTYNSTYTKNVFSCKWDPKSYDRNKLHSIKITVLTYEDHIFVEEHQFSLDEKYTELSKFYSFFLIFNLPYFAEILFVFIFSLEIIIPTIVFIFPGSIISVFIEHIFELLFPTFSNYFLNFNNYLPMYLFNSIIYLMPMGGVYECLPDKYGLPTIFGTYINGEIHYLPVIFLFYVQKFIAFDIGIYLNYYFKLKLLSNRSRSRALVFFYFLFSNIFWIFSFLVALIYTYSRICPVKNIFLTILSSHTYFPVIAIYTKIHQVSYSKRRIKIL